MTVQPTDGRVACGVGGVACPDQLGALFRDPPIARNRFPHACSGTEKPVAAPRNPSPSRERAARGALRAQLRAWRRSQGIGRAPHQLASVATMQR